MFFNDPMYGIIADTLRANNKIIFDGQYDVDGGQTFIVPFVLKSPAPGNRADIDLTNVFEAFPDGVAVQRLADIEHTMVRLPVGGPGQRNTEEARGTFRLTVTKANWLSGEVGVMEGVTITASENPAGDLSMADIVAKYNKLPEHKQRQFVNAAKLLLKGLAL